MSKGRTYRDKLLDPRWQRRRLDILNAADFTCRDCGSKDKTLHVHHAYYLHGKEPWEYHDDLLRCVCEDCHALVRETDEMLDGQLHDLRLMILRFSIDAKDEFVNAMQGVLSCMVDRVEGERRLRGLSNLLAELELGDEFGGASLYSELDRLADEAERKRK